MTPKADDGSQTLAGATDLPRKTTVVVIGGGIAGVTVALNLARSGIPVVLAEKGRIAGEQSSRNWGWCRVMGRALHEIPLGLESLRMWRQMNELVEGETGYRENGIIYVCRTKAEMAQQESWLESARHPEIDAKLLTGSELVNKITGAADTFVAGLYTPTDGRAEPSLAVAAMAKAAAKSGAQIFTNCAVRAIETSAGRISGVITEHGAIQCETVVLAGGAWSRLFLGNFGIDFPQLKVLGSVLRTAPIEGLPSLTIGADNFAFRPRLDGGYTIARRGKNTSSIDPDSFRLFFDFLPSLKTSWHEIRLRVGRSFFDGLNMPRRWRADDVTPFEKIRVLDPEPDGDLLADAMRNLTKAFPAFASVTEVERWGGLIDVTPDTVPVISTVDNVPGLVLSTGYSGHGFGIGPGAGRLAADLVTGAKPIVDPTPFRLNRFARSKFDPAARKVARQ